MVACVPRRQLPTDISGDYDYNVLLKSAAFWRKLEADKVLVFQADALILRPGARARLTCCSRGNTTQDHTQEREGSSGARRS